MTKDEYEKYIDVIPDFPKKGVVFKDMFPLLKHRLSDVVEDLGTGINWNEIDLVVGIESRGFLLGSALAIKHSKGFVPIRKKGKLPPPTLHESYDLEYGTDTLEMAVNKEPLRIVIVDDVLATGGTMKAAMSLCEKNNFKVQCCVVVMDLKFLNNLSESFDIRSVLSYS